MPSHNSQTRLRCDFAMNLEFSVQTGNGKLLYGRFLLFSIFSLYISLYVALVIGGLAQATTTCVKRFCQCALPCEFPHTNHYYGPTRQPGSSFRSFSLITLRFLHCVGWRVRRTGHPLLIHTSLRITFGAFSTQGSFTTCVDISRPRIISSTV
jgi:hypothetical protein